MRTRYVILTACVVAVIAGGACWAQPSAAADRVPAQGEAPIVTRPMAGELVGPSTLIVGKAPYGSVVCIVTDVFDQRTGLPYYRLIPGHRHKVNPDGTFSLLVSTPRVYFGTIGPQRYEIHVFTVDAAGNESGHTIIPVTQDPSIQWPRSLYNITSTGVFYTD